jgi:hypothetical protein
MRLVSDRDHSIEAARKITSDFMPGEFYGWLAFADDEAVGVTMLEPCILARGARHTNAGYWRYLWVSPDHRKTALYPRLVFTMIADAAEVGIDVVYGAIRRPDVAAGHLALGMQKVAEIPVLAKPLSPARLLSKFRGLGNAAVQLSSVPDFAYGQYLALRRLSLPSGYSVRDVAATDADPETILPALRELYTSELQRPLNPESFASRYDANADGEEYRVLSVEKAGETHAAIVYRTALRGNDIHNLVLMELGYRLPDQNALRVGLSELERRAMRLGCEVVLCLSNSSVMQSHLRKWGYFKSNETYILMKKPTRPNTAGTITDKTDDWHFTFADHDAF